MNTNDDKKQLVGYREKSEIISKKSRESIRILKIITPLWYGRSEKNYRVSVVRQFAVFEWFSASHDIKISNF